MIVAYGPRFVQNRLVATTSSLRALATAIRQRREEMGLTQEDMAYESGISVRHYQKLEAGGTDPRISTLHALAKVLKTTVQRILDRADDLQSQRPHKR
jgi:transcriptional regulator with XRE-family HTH domain